MRRHLKLILLSFLLMAIFGFINNMRGTLIPSIRADFGVSYGKIGLMLFIGSFGFMTATFFGGMLAARFGLKKLIIFGLSAITLGVFLMPQINSFLFLIILMGILGMGVGTIEISTNSLGAKIFIKKSGMMMNLLHLFFGIGAALGPRYAGFLLQKGIGWDYIYLSSLVLIALVFIFLLFTSFPRDLDTQKKNNIPLFDMFLEKKVWFFTGVLGFGIVAEIGTANWLVNFLQVERGLTPASSSFYLSLFFITFTAGRLVGSYFTEILGYIRIIFYSTGIALTLFMLGLFLENWGNILFSITGFFISIIFPTIMAVIMHEYEDNVSAYMGFIITGSSAVNMVSNWVIGNTTDILGVYLGFASILIYIILIIVFLFLLKSSLKNKDIV